MSHNGIAETKFPFQNYLKTALGLNLMVQFIQDIFGTVNRKAPPRLVAIQQANRDGIFLLKSLFCNALHNGAR